eukprot:gnl/TRDRNA2_/TRDRNA2_177712_c0_seq2.p1 gnl/TRDRNA2_/TRDRNA2_177712_c0~~gnl/TRDRNA2_/TRDRNA2_177712_c0_seq2.p1  ORF type:complete len:599 (-),score=77.10 gnl/TRDRNA2_/TRDRNA2_177712_c0_seq2:192-1988(-)
MLPLTAAHPPLTPQQGRRRPRQTTLHNPAAARHDDQIDGRLPISAAHPPRLPKPARTRPTASQILIGNGEELPLLSDGELPLPGDGELAPPGDGEEGRCRQEVWLSDAAQEAVSATAGQNFLVIHAGLATQRCPHIVHPEEPPAELSLDKFVPPPGVRCILVLVEQEPSCPSDTDLEALFDLLMVTSLQSPPVVALLLRPLDGDDDDCDGDAVQRNKLLELGAHATIAQSEFRGEFREEMLVSCMWQTLQECEIAIRELTTEQLVNEPDAFWKFVHRHISGFPSLDTEVKGSPRIGEFIGRRRKVLRRLGSGGFGTVFLCRNMDTKELQAIKVVDKKSLTSLERVEQLASEMSILQRMRHPHIVASGGCCHASRHVYMLMSYAGPCTLARVLEPSRPDIDEPWWARGVFVQIASAVAYVHSRNVAHRDIKPENVMLNTDELRQGDSLPVAKLGDFGLAIDTSSSLRRKVVEERGAPYAGTMPFVAPEVLRRSPHSAQAADVWSLGVMLLELMVGVNAFPVALGWTSPQGPGPLEEAARQLEELCEDPSHLLETLEQWDFFQETTELDEVLAGMITTSAKHRWTAGSVVSGSKRCKART